jgi:hypothetical protein
MVTQSADRMDEAPHRTDHNCGGRRHHQLHLQPGTTRVLPSYLTAASVRCSLFSATVWWPSPLCLESLVGFRRCLGRPIYRGIGRNYNFPAAGYALLTALLAVVRKAPKHKDLTISAIMYFISLSLISEVVLMQRPSVLYGV